MDIEAALRPPSPGAARSERLRFIRNWQLVALLPSAVLVIVLVVAEAPRWAVVLDTVLVVLLALDAVWLTVRVRHVR